MLITFNFEVHQPYRLNKKLKNSNNLKDRYFDNKLNKEVFNKVANNCYIPTNELLLELIDEHNFKVNFSISGVFIEQAIEYNDYVLDLFVDLVKTGNVELIGETYYHSLSSLLEDESEFIENIVMHREIYKEIFKFKSRVFRNTELIYNNRIGKIVKDLGFEAIFTEGLERILEWRSPNYLYQSPDGIKILLRNYRLSDDIGFRFSAKNWEEYPLTADKYAYWLSVTPGEVINIYMDYETFGEHHWKDTGIFEFLRYLPIEINKHENLEVVNVSEAIERLEPKGEYFVHEFSTISWADSERDVSAWLGNRMQIISFEKLCKIRDIVKDKDEVRKIYGYLTTSDHLYYQSTKGFSDGEVHNYFSYFDTPFDAFATYLNVLYDFEYKIKDRERENYDDSYMYNIEDENIYEEYNENDDNNNNSENILIL